MLLEKWQADSAFTAKVTDDEGLERSVDGNVKNSTDEYGHELLSSDSD